MVHHGYRVVTLTILIQLAIALYNSSGGPTGVSVISGPAMNPDTTGPLERPCQVQMHQIHIFSSDREATLWARAHCHMHLHISDLIDFQSTIFSSSLF